MALSDIEPPYKCDINITASEGLIAIVNKSQTEYQEQMVTHRISQYSQ